MARPEVAGCRAQRDAGHRPRRRIIKQRRAEQVAEPCAYGHAQGHTSTARTVHLPFPLPDPDGSWRRKGKRDRATTFGKSKGASDSLSVRGFSGNRAKLPGKHHYCMLCSYTLGRESAVPWRGPMEMNRRELVLGALAGLAAGTGLTPAEAATKPTKKSSLFAGTAVDNGVTFKLTNFAVIDKKWHKQMVK